MAVIPEILDSVGKKVQATIDTLKQNKDWSMDSINGKIDMIQITVTEVEKTALDLGGMTGEDKKKLAIDIINKFIDIPILPEGVEAILIGWVIDFFIGIINKLIGKIWVKKIAPVA
jgi:hypothetical protein